MTQETYEFLTKEHGICIEICKHCMSHEVEVYQDEWASCYNCWCLSCEPKISLIPQD